jgi:hypothetical protein
VLGLGILECWNFGLFDFLCFGVLEAHHITIHISLSTHRFQAMF